MLQEYRITLDEAKTYLRVENNEEDSLITSLINAAESFVLRQTGRNSIDSYDLRAAELLILSDFYERRTAQEEARRVVITPVLEMLLKSARVDDSCI
jgi:uncharacterized phage protein (predicted DNA packaging)